MEYNEVNSNFKNNMFPMNDYLYTNDRRGVPNPIPFYKAYQVWGDFYNMDAEERDIEKLRGMYPKVARDVQKHIDEQLDKMEYDGSIMFDEYPDRLMIRRICTNIYDKVKDLYEVEDNEVERDEMLAMNRGSANFGFRNNWMQDLVQIMLINEISRRRCRRRNCNRWF